MASPPHPPAAPTRHVLEGVPRVGFYPDMIQHESRCPEDIIFPSCLRAILEYLGEATGCQHCREQDPAWALGCTYAHLLGASGAAFYLNWGPGWGINLNLHHMSDDPWAPFSRAFQAIGYGHTLVEKGSGDDRARFRDAIVESIHGQGRPVMAFGVVGPPDEPCIISGYDEGGDALIGWSFFQGFPEFAGSLDLEPSGCFRKRDWFPDTAALILIGDKGERPTHAESDRRGLAWGLQVMRTPITPGDRRNGLAAYGAWAEALSDDAAFEAELPALRTKHVAHDDAVGYVAEARWYGSIHLAQVAQRQWKAADELYRAAACFAAEHALMWDAWAAVGGHGHGDDRVQQLARPEVRRQLVDIIYRALSRDAEAARWLEQAVAKVG